MYDYRFSEYGVPGLSDVGTIRLPRANAPVAEKWLTGQNSRILANAPLRTGEQVIRFEDPNYQSIIEKLSKKTAIGNHEHFYDVAESPTRNFEMSREGYEALNNLKAKNAPLDFLDRITQAPNRNWDVNPPVYSPDNYDQLSRAYSQLKIPIEVVEPNYVKELWLDNEGHRLSDYERQMTQPKYVFDPYEGKQGTMYLPNRQSTGYQNRHTQSLIEGLADRFVQGSDELIDRGLPAQVVANSGASEYALGAGNQIQGIHDAATRFAIKKNLIQDPRLLDESFQTMMAQIKSANPDYASYVAQPEFRNQIRTAGRLAGALFT